MVSQGRASISADKRLTRSVLVSSYGSTARRLESDVFYSRMIDCHGKSRMDADEAMGALAVLVMTA